MNEFESKLLAKIDTLIKLVAVSGLSDQSFKEKVQLLTASGLEPKDIAIILGKTANHVSVTLNDLKKEKSKNG